MGAREWFRRPDWAGDWDAWKAAALEVAELEREHLPWPYNPEPPSAFWELVSLTNKMLETPHE